MSAGALPTVRYWRQKEDVNGVLIIIRGKSNRELKKYFTIVFTKILKSITVLQTDYHDLLKAHTLTLSMVWGGKTSPAHYFELKYVSNHILLFNQHSQ